MYTPTVFAETNQDVLYEFIRTHSFATIVTSGEAAPTATHMPFVLDAEKSALRSHVARANPQWRHFARGDEVLVIFQGPHAYISPTWYQSEFAVPTWNYAAVHVYGVPRLIDDPNEVADVLDELVSIYEQEEPHAWSIPWQDEQYGKLTRGLVAFEVSITRIEGKFKFNQNRSRDDRLGVVDALTQKETVQAQAVAEIMQAHLANEDE